MDAYFRIFLAIYVMLYVSLYVYYGKTKPKTYYQCQLEFFLTKLPTPFSSALFWALNYFVRFIFINIPDKSSGIWSPRRKPDSPRKLVTRITIVLNHPSRDFPPHMLLQQGLVRTPGAPLAPAQRVCEDRSPDVGHEFGPSRSPHLRAAVLLHTPKTFKHGEYFLDLCFLFLIFF